MLGRLFRPRNNSDKHFGAPLPPLVHFRGESERRRYRGGLADTRRHKAPMYRGNPFKWQHLNLFEPFEKYVRELGVFSSHR